MAVKYVKDFEFPSSGKTQVRGYMRGGSCGYAKGGDVVASGKTPGKGPEHTLGFAKGGHAKSGKGAPKGLSVMIAVGPEKAMKKGLPPVGAAPIGLKKGGMAKVEKVMGEYGKGELHSGSKKGPVVKNPKQAVAIALSEARKAGAKVPVKKADGGLMISPGMGAMTDADAKQLAVKRMLMERAKMSGKGPTRAQFDAMLAKRMAAPKITPEQHRMMRGETMIGRKKGGSVKC
jgi:hypothetical protein